MDSGTGYIFTFEYEIVDLRQFLPVYESLCQKSRIFRYMVVL